MNGEEICRWLKSVQVAVTCSAEVVEMSKGETMKENERKTKTAWYLAAIKITLTLFCILH